MLEKNPEDTRALLLAGLTEGMRIVDALDSSSYLTAFLRAGAMQNHLEKALELEPKLHDAYYGLGVYHIRGKHRELGENVPVFSSAIRVGRAEPI